MYQTFSPTGATVLVDTTERQAKSRNGGAITPTSYRIRNPGAADAFISWAPPKSDGTAPSITVTAPIAGTPQDNTLGIPAGGVETFSLAGNAYFKASAGATFEVTPGEGL